MIFSTKIDLVKRVVEPYTKHNVVKLSSLKEYFSDHNEVEKMIERVGDIVVYEYFENSFDTDDENLNFGLTVIYPGRVGREYFLTRG
ncbi:MAG: glucose-6-phosphate isomerase family protein, partial [Thermosphaera sp.]